ncbi:glycoside hydrolase family 19 protein [Paracoccus sp. MBLB3053]|uniref:Glycoside hydrolase family 19 protein n=1 Tax=Paracoccus aurantius TaxID=3073814 RepID=A0ABU2HW88_9RHOB|nr:glycoside hydrolase family 19 protein [Paracoccus sp. MBLB3053]MDS9468992.1 glycoside hydrolase family 19 protein [Paracoccus sp. MBLB3053]
MDAILSSWDQNSPIGDSRWLAYMLATTFHETNRTMQPVREAYWLSENWRRNNLRYYPYYGRGYVQLTWAENYAKAGQFVGVDLVNRPDLAMAPDIAATVMFFGMRDGWFRGDSRGRQKLSRYFNQSVDDPIGAREIINGREFKRINGRTVLLATVIAQYHNTFLRAIHAAQRVGLPRQRAFGMGFEPEFMAPGIGDMFGPELGETGAMQMPELSESVAGFDDMTADDGVFLGRVGPVAADIDEGPSPESEETYLVDRTVEIVTAFFTSNEVKPAELPTLLTSVHEALSTMLMPMDEEEEEADDEEDVTAPPAPEKPKPKSLPARKRTRTSRGRSSGARTTEPA